MLIRARERFWLEPLCPALCISYCEPSKDQSGECPCGAQAVTRKDEKRRHLSHRFALALRSIALAAAVAGCMPPPPKGQNFDQGSSSAQNAHTGGKTPDGKPYSLGGPAEDMRRAQDRLKATLTDALSPATQTEIPSPATPSQSPNDLARRIRAAELNFVNSEVAQVSLTVQGVDRPIEFSFPRNTTQTNSLLSRTHQSLGTVRSTTVPAYQANLICEYNSPQSQSCPVASLILMHEAARPIETTASAVVVFRSENVEVTVLTASEPSFADRSSAAPPAGSAGSSSPQIGASTGLITQPILSERERAQSNNRRLIWRWSSFEVLYGAAGYTLKLGSSKYCATGRLVDSNTLFDSAPPAEQAIGTPDLTMASEPAQLILCDTKEPAITTEQVEVVGSDGEGGMFFSISNSSPLPTLLLIEQAEARARLRLSQTPSAWGTRSSEAVPASGLTANPSVRQTKAEPLPRSGSEASPKEESNTAAASDSNSPVTLVDCNSIQLSTNTLVPYRLVNSDGSPTAECLLLQDRARTQVQAALSNRVVDLGGRLTRFARGFIANRADLLAIFSEPGRELSAVFFYLAAIESNFFNSSNYPLQVSPVLAGGPWQIMPTTATDRLFSLNVKPIIRREMTCSQNRTCTVSMLDPCDGRADLYEATRGARDYLRAILADYDGDPRYAALGYNWGPYRSLRQVRGPFERTAKGVSLKRLATVYKVSFWQIERFIPRETRDYVARFAALTDIGTRFDASEVTPFQPWSRPVGCSAIRTDRQALYQPINSPDQTRQALTQQGVPPQG